MLVSQLYLGWIKVVYKINYQLISYSICAVYRISRLRLMIMILASDAHDSLSCVSRPPSFYLSAVPDACPDFFILSYYLCFISGLLLWYPIGYPNSSKSKTQTIAGVERASICYPFYFTMWWDAIGYYIHICEFGVAARWSIGWNKHNCTPMNDIGLRAGDNHGLVKVTTHWCCTRRGQQCH